MQVNIDHHTVQPQMCTVTMTPFYSKPVSQCGGTIDLLISRIFSSSLPNLINYFVYLFPKFHEHHPQLSELACLQTDKHRSKHYSCQPVLEVNRVQCTYNA